MIFRIKLYYWQKIRRIGIGVIIDCDDLEENSVFYIKIFFWKTEPDRRRGRFSERWA
jgi:hypothetical protein